MNKRIRELAEQAGIKIIPLIIDDEEYYYEDVRMDGSEDLEKFAKLIVAECAKIAFLGSSLSVDDSIQVRDMIIKYFGEKDEPNA